jgi:hypothetical protein
MSLRELLADGRLRAHTSSVREVAELLRVVDRDLADAAIPELSTDRRFATAYNAVLQRLKGCLSPALRALRVSRIGEW